MLRLIYLMRLGAALGARYHFHIEMLQRLYQKDQL